MTGQSDVAGCAGLSGSHPTGRMPTDDDVVVGTDLFQDHHTRFTNDASCVEEFDHASKVRRPGSLVFDLWQLSSWSRLVNAASRC
ncbi:MAG TPA: hypothetical protein VIL51_11355 [Thermoleophilia bacterium]